ncbi:MAG: hypothetical protein WAV10_01620 [Minisyncoccia bacterium]
MKTKIILIIMLMMGVSSINAQRNKYGKILFTRESFKDTISKINYTVSERNFRNVFGYKKKIITIEFDLPTFIVTNKNLNNGAYEELKFITACKILNEDVKRIYSQADDYCRNYWRTDEEENYYDFREIIIYENTLKERINKTWFKKEAWIEAKIADKSDLKKFPVADVNIRVIETAPYGGFHDYTLINYNLNQVLIKLLRLHKLAYTSYPQGIIDVDFDKKLSVGLQNEYFY